MYIRYFILAIIALIAFIFTFVTCPIWAFWAALFKLRKLPWIFSWVHTHDDDIYGSKMTDEPIPSTILGRFKRACWWIWRNPNYGFNTEVLGLPVEGTKIVQDIREGKEPNEYHWTLFDRDGKKYFGLFWTKSYGNRYIKLWIGWQYHPLDGSDRYMMKFSFNPFRSIK